MNRAAFMNLFLAVLWLFLFPGGLVSFIFGLLIGFLLLYAFQAVLDSSEYVRRVLAFFNFLGVFAKEFVVSNIVLAKAVLRRPKEDINPNFITLDVNGLREWEIFFLSQCLTLTPGTTGVDYDNVRQILIVHAFDAEDPDAVRANIENSLKKAMLQFSR